MLGVPSLTVLGLVLAAVPSTCLGETPLRRALNCRQPAMIGLLLAHGANPDSPDKRGLTPRQVAKRRGLRIGDA
jgi:ankyrin repeat protein